MIAKSAFLVESLPPILQGALNGTLHEGEEAVIIVRGSPREALAVTRQRLILLKEKGLSDPGGVQVSETPLADIERVRTEPLPVGGRLTWEGSAPGAAGALDYAAYDQRKFASVEQKLGELMGGRAAAGDARPAPRDPAAPRSCPKCRTALPEGGCWCPRCGLQTADPCWECGRALPEGADYCPYCGTETSEPAVVSCPECGVAVARGKGYCSACGAQARILCAECERPLRRDWPHCPDCGGEPVGPAGEADAAPEAPQRGREDAPLPAAASRAPEAQKLNDAGIRAYEAEDYAEAARLFRDATRAAPDNASFWTNLGVAYGQLEDDLQAFNAYQRAVELDPGEVAAYLYMGQLYAERERATEAREMWEKVIQLAPDSDEADEARENLQNLEEV